MQEKKKLFIDLDDTVVESIFLNRVNRLLGTNHKIDDFTNYYIDEIIPNESKEKFYSSFCDTNPYFEVGFQLDAKESIKKLSKKYKIYICSGCVMFNDAQKSSPIFSCKYDFLIKEFPFLRPQQFIFTNSKEILQGDIIIDDYLPNMTENNISCKLLYTSYHNKNYTDNDLKKLNITRVNSWKEICKILL